MYVVYIYIYIYIYMYTGGVQIETRNVVEPIEAEAFA